LAKESISPNGVFLFVAHDVHDLLKQAKFMKKAKKASKKKTLTPAQKKVAEVMHEFKEGELHSGKSDTIVTDRKQAIAIALSEASEVEGENPKKTD